MKRIFDVDSNRQVYGPNGQLLNPGDRGFEEAIEKVKETSFCCSNTCY